MDKNSSHSPSKLLRNHYFLTALVTVGLQILLILILYPRNIDEYLLDQTDIYVYSYVLNTFENLSNIYYWVYPFWKIITQEPAGFEGSYVHYMWTFKIIRIVLVASHTFLIFGIATVLFREEKTQIYSAILGSFAPTTFFFIHSAFRRSLVLILFEASFFIFYSNFRNRRFLLIILCFIAVFFSPIGILILFLPLLWPFLNTLISFRTKINLTTISKRKTTLLMSRIFIFSALILLLIFLTNPINLFTGFLPEIKIDFNIRIEFFIIFLLILILFVSFIIKKEKNTLDWGNRIIIGIFGFVTLLGAASTMDYFPLPIVYIFFGIIILLSDWSNILHKIENEAIKFGMVTVNALGIFARLIQYVGITISSVYPVEAEIQAHTIEIFFQPLHFMILFGVILSDISSQDITPFTKLGWPSLYPLIFIPVVFQIYIQPLTILNSGIIVLFSLFLVLLMGIIWQRLNKNNLNFFQTTFFVVIWLLIFLFFVNVIPFVVIRSYLSNFFSALYSLLGTVWFSELLSIHLIFFLLLFNLAPGCLILSPLNFEKIWVILPTSIAVTTASMIFFSMILERTIPSLEFSVPIFFFVLVFIFGGIRLFGYYINRLFKNKRTINLRNCSLI